jgi:hypothetical protein
MLYKDVVYMISDELKLNPDDSDFNEEHILTQIDRYRSFLLKQKYADIKKDIPLQNYQLIRVALPVSTTNTVFQSNELIPKIMSIGNTRVYNDSYYDENFIFTTKDRMKWVGYQQFTPNFIFCSIDPNHKLSVLCKNNTLLTNLLPTNNPNKIIYIYAIFEESIDANDTKYGTADIDILDKEFPLEESLISPLTQMVVKELSVGLTVPNDTINNANSDSDRFSKSPQQQQQ